MPRLRPKGKPSTKTRATCENCGTRFKSKNISWRKIKRKLHGFEPYFHEINAQRMNAGNVPLSEQSVLCRECRDMLYVYASSRSSGSQTSQSSLTSESDDSESTRSHDTDPSEAYATKPSSPISNVIPDPPFNPFWQGNNDAAMIHRWMGAENAAPGPSRLAENYRAPWEEKCLLCPLLFELNLEKPAHKLSSNRFLQVIINGELATSGMPTAHPGSLVCDPCYRDKINEYQLLCENVQRSFDPKETHAQSQESNFSAMETSQILNEENSGSSNAESKSLPSDEDALSEKSDVPSPPKKKSAATQTILVSIPSVAISGHSCFVCGKEGTRKRVGKKCRLGLFRSTGIYIHPENRICGEHLEQTNRCLLNAEGLAIFLAQVRYDETFFTAEQLVELISFLEKSHKYSDACKGRMSFRDGHKYTSSDYTTMLGVSKEQFLYLHDIISPHMRNTCARSTQDALAIFLMKLRLNPSVTTLACLFNTTKQRISKSIITVRQLLKKYFVPQFLGYDHINRREYIDKHTTIISKTLTGANGEQCIVVIDGTYLYFYKSSNYSLQRRMFSLHKFRNLLKVMMIVSTTGYIMAIEGPYYGDGSNNDSQILTSMQKDTEGFRSFYKPGDFIIEDRGFRDSNQLMTDLGFSVKMPHFLGKRAQHPTSEANESRLVTKMRWVVESVNGRLKNVFRFFRDTIPNTYIKNNAAYEMFEIACALLNAFHPPIKNDEESDKWVAEQMLERSEMSNLLKNLLEDENYVRQTLQWEQINESCLHDFPRLTMKELREFTFGVYQLKQARSYMADTMGDDGTYDIFFHAALQHGAVKFRLQSRHKNSKRHDLWIGYNSRNQGTKSILGWYCRCPNGARVVGCCAHIAAVIWYLSYSRYCQQIKAPAGDLDEMVRNAPNYKYDNEYLDLPGNEEEALLLQRGENLIEEETSSDGEWLL